MLSTISKQQINRIKAYDAQFVNTNSKLYQSLFAGIKKLTNIKKDLFLEKPEFSRLNEGRGTNHQHWNNYVNTLILGERKDMGPFKKTDLIKELTDYTANKNMEEQIIKGSIGAQILAKEQFKIQKTINENCAKVFTAYHQEENKDNIISKFFQVGNPWKPKTGVNGQNIPLQLDDMALQYYGEKIMQSKHIITTKEPINQLYIGDLKSLQQKRKLMYEQIGNTTLEHFNSFKMNSNPKKNSTYGKNIITERFFDKHLLTTIAQLSNETLIVPVLAPKDIYSLMSVLEFNSEDEKQLREIQKEYNTK